MNRRTFLVAGLALPGLNMAGAEVITDTPGNYGDEPWLSGASAWNDLPETAVAESGTVQVVDVSPVLYPQFVAMLIHNASDKAVMLSNVRGTLRAPDLAGFEQSLSAYGIPNPIIPPGEYWIGRLLTPESLAVGTEIEFEAEIQLATELPRITTITTLLTAIAPKSGFELPESGEPWPIRYENDAPYSTARIATFQQIFFDDNDKICGFISGDDASNNEGVAEFRMELTHSPGASTGGAVLGETSDRWLAQWSHAPMWGVFTNFDPGS